MRNILILVSLLLIAGCTNPEKARRVLAAEGVSNVQLTGYRIFTCGDDYTYHDGFTGIRNGQNVSGAVCGGILKGSQVKYD